MLMPNLCRLPRFFAQISPLLGTPNSPQISQAQCNLINLSKCVTLWTGHRGHNCLDKWVRAERPADSSSKLFEHDWLELSLTAVPILLLGREIADAACLVIF